MKDNEACPTCGILLDAATHLEDESKKPKPGDLSVCLYCGEFLVFADFGFSVLGDGIAGLPADVRQQLFKIRAAARLLSSRRTHQPTNPCPSKHR